MRPLVLAVAILLCVSVSQADYIYDFENLPTVNAAVNTQDDGTVTWKAVVNPNQWMLRQDASPNKYIDISTNSQEQIVSTLDTDKLLFHIDPGVTKVTLSFNSKMNDRTGALAGIWIDGGLDPGDPDGGDNVMANNNYELLCQFGYGGYTNGPPAGGRWRIRGANGLGSTYSATGAAMPGVPALTEFLITLDLDLAANPDANGDPAGTMVLKVENLSTLVETEVIASTSLKLNDPTLTAAQKAIYKDPSKWTGWWVRSQATQMTDPNYVSGPMTVDNLTLIPEPVTMSLLVLGGLACLRRRR